MNRIHSTAIIDPKAEIGDGVTVVPTPSLESM